MFRNWLPVLNMLALAALAGLSAAGEPPCARSAPAVVEQTYPTTKVHLYEDQDLIAVPRLTVREVVTRVPTMSLQMEYKEEKRCVTVMVPKPREEEQIVKYISWVPETTVDPNTGRSCTTYKCVENCKVVKVQHVEIVPETKEYLVKVPVLKPVAAAVDVQRLTVDATTTAATATRLRMAETPSEVTVPTCPVVLPPLDCHPPH